MMLTDKFISIVVVCYRDEGAVKELLKRLEATMAKITPNWEVIYVNDDSPDNAEKVLLEEAKRNKRLTVIAHSRNFGAQVAFTTGITQSSGDAVIIMDGDLQDPPELIEEFARRWLSGHDVVYGIRAKRHEGFLRNRGYKLFYSIFRKIAYIPIPLDAGEFSLMDRRVVNVLLKCPERDRLIRGLRAYAGFKQTGVEFERPQRFAGESTQSLLDYMMWAYKSFVSYSLAPLRFITIGAFIFAFIMLLFLAYYFIAWLFGFPAPPGFMTLITFLLGIGAVIMFSLGIIGEYLGRIFLEIKQRPTQVVRLVVNDQREVPTKWVGMEKGIDEDLPAKDSKQDG